MGQVSRDEVEGEENGLFHPGKPRPMGVDCLLFRVTETTAFPPARAFVIG